MVIFFCAKLKNKYSCSPNFIKGMGFNYYSFDSNNPVG